MTEPEHTRRSTVGRQIDEQIDEAGQQWAALQDRRRQSSGWKRWSASQHKVMIVCGVILVVMVAVGVARSI